MKALFLFEQEAAAHRAMAEWFQKENRRIVDVRVVVGSRYHRADAQWLERPKDEWPDAAHRYWAGDMTADPRPEIVLEGHVYLPSWDTFALFGSGRHD